MAAAMEKKIDQIVVLITTWNVGNAEPRDLRPLLVSKKVDHVDMIVLGLQEARYEKSKEMRGVEGGEFFDRAQALLGEQWYRARVRRLGEMELGIFCRTELKSLVKDIHAAVERTGIADIGNNKGGISIQLTIQDTSFVFVSSHLAAHEGAQYREERHKDVSEIMEGTLHFNTSHLDPSNFVDHLFWMGDLNYRMVYSFAGVNDPPFEQQWEYFKKLVDSQNWGKLQEHDELIHERQHEAIFVGFDEALPNFNPTFKVERVPGFSYTKQRLPAWCDRVLWSSLPHRESNVKNLAYEPLGEVTTSDHKPVQAVFQIKLATPASLHTPPLSKKDSPLLGCLIVFHELSADSMPRMDVASENDCYVKFLSKTLFFESNKFCTKPKDDTATPYWSSTEIPTLTTRFANVEVLRDEVLFLCVMDADMMSDDIVGFAPLKLADVVAHQRASLVAPFNPFKFRLPLRFQGVNRGFISGSVEIQLQVADV